MKTFLSVILLTFLVSCGENSVVETSTPTEKVSQEIGAAMDELPNEIAEVTEVSAPKVVELSTSYTNPKAEIMVGIDFTLDENDTISEITVSSESHPTDQHIVAINEGVQSAIGMTVEEASEISVAGSSLTTAAYRDAMKNM